MAESFQYDVFLSHSAKDKAVVRPVAERLQKDGLKVWFDEWVLKPGDSIPAKIEEGLEHSRVLVLCMSANAFGSDWARLEGNTFRFRDPLNKDRRFIPLRLDDAPIKGPLAQFLYLNWCSASREQEYSKLLEACRPPAKLPVGARPPTSQDAGSTIERTFACQFREFRGRLADLQKLERLLLNDPKCMGVIIGALGGMGKTALANQFCTAYGVGTFFNVIVGASAKKKYLDASAFDLHHGEVRSTDHAIRTVREYLVEVAGQLRVRDAGARPDDKLKDEIRAAIGGRRAVFLLDNLEMMDETSAALNLLRRLCSPPGQKFLITTREVPDSLGQGVVPLRLKRLESNDAHLLVRDLLEELDPTLADSIRDDNAAISAILKRAGGHPLALRLLTGKLVAQGEKAFLMMPDPSRPTGKAEWSREFFGFVFDETFLTYLKPIAVNAACVIASYTHGVTEPVLIAACQAADTDVTPDELEEAIRRLLRTFCVDREHLEGEAVLTMHPLTREFFVRLADAKKSQ